MMAMAKALEAAPAPALEAGQGRVTVMVSGEILLPERDYSVK
jgi:predicted secreted protein